MDTVKIGSEPHKGRKVTPFDSTEELIVAVRADEGLLFGIKQDFGDNSEAWQAAVAHWEQVLKNCSDKGNIYAVPDVLRFTLARSLPGGEASVRIARTKEDLDAGRFTGEIPEAQIDSITERRVFRIPGCFQLLPPDIAEPGTLHFDIGDFAQGGISFRWQASGDDDGRPALTTAEAESWVSDWEEARREITARNFRLKLPNTAFYPPPKVESPKAPSAKVSKTHAIYTSEEMRAQNMAVADGRTGRNYTKDEQAVALIHRVPKAPFSVRFEAPPEYRALGLSASALLECMERLKNEQDADAIAVTHYLSSLFASALEQNKEGVVAGGWVDLNDIAKMAIDKNFPNLLATKRLEILRRVYLFLIAGAWMRVIGERSIGYVSEGNKIDTRLNAPFWQILDTYGPTQPELPALFPITDELPPVRVRLALSEAFTKLLSDPKTAQYLPCGEMLAAIPKGRVPGAWAFVMGYSLAGDWRIRSTQVENATFTMTRRDLLTRYTPKIQTVESLYAKEPGRVIRYYNEAIRELVGIKFVKPVGEAADGAALKKLGKKGRPIEERYNWLDEWLDTPVVLLPGEALEAAVIGRAIKLPPASRPKALPGKSHRGRPKKPTTD